jgi:hypothetical protein
VDGHYIDKRFSEELQGLEVNPPVEAWMAISEGMDTRKRRRLLPLFLRSAAAIAAFVVATFSFWFFVFDEDESDALMTLQNPIASPEPSALSESGALTDYVDLFPDNISGSPENKTHEIRLSLPEPLLIAQAGNVHMLQPKTTAKLEASRHIFFPAAESPQDNIAYIEMADDYVQPAVLPDPQPTGTSGFSLGAHFAPQYNYRHLANNSNSTYAEIPFSSLESQLLTLSAGLSVNYRLSSRWIIQTGLNYNNMGQFIKDIHAFHHVNNLPLYYQSQEILTSMGNITINDPYHHFDDVKSSRVSSKQSLDNFDIKSLHKTDDGLTQIFRFAEIPILMRYQLYSRNVGVQLKGGFAANYLLQKDVFLGTNLMQTPIGETHGIELFNMSFIGGFALNIPVTKGLMLQMEPTLQYFIQPFVHNGVPGGNALPYNFSLQTGVSYRF